MDENEIELPPHYEEAFSFAQRTFMDAFKEFEAAGGDMRFLASAMLSCAAQGYKIWHGPTALILGLEELTTMTRNAVIAETTRPPGKPH